MKRAIAAAGFTLLTIACGGGSSPSGPDPVPIVVPTPVPTPVPLFVRSGSGDTVFDLPARVQRIRIQATYAEFSSNFIVHIGGSHIVNELLGTFWNATTFDGTYVVPASGRTVEITHSTGVQWTFTEVR